MSFRKVTPGESPQTCLIKSCSDWNSESTQCLLPCVPPTPDFHQLQTSRKKTGLQRNCFVFIKWFSPVSHSELGTVTMSSSLLKPSCPPWCLVFCPGTRCRRGEEVQEEGACLCYVDNWMLYGSLSLPAQFNRCAHMGSTSVRNGTGLGSFCGVPKRDEF